MRDDHALSLLRSGIIESKEGNQEVARRYLERATWASDDHDLLAEAWFWMSQVTDDIGEKRKALESSLSHDMQHARARRALAILDGKLKPEEIVNPDALPAAPQELTQASADRFMCPKCGGRMVFAPDGSSLVCEFCTRNETLGTQVVIEAEEQDFLVAMATVRGHRKPVAEQIFHCDGCGAEFLLPPEQISATCAYCGSAHVVKLETTRELLPPDGIIPHGFSQRRANHHLVQWTEKQGITPKNKVDAPRGLYMPIWTFDVGGEIDYSGEIVEYEEKRYTAARMPRIRQVKDNYPIMIDDLPIPASRKLARHISSLLPTFNLRETRSYDPRYLADWPAEIYDVPMGDAALDARSQAFSRYKVDLPSRIGQIRNLRLSSANLAIESFKLVLIPVWVTEIPYGGREHLILINGQNGVVHGETPKKETPGLLDWLSDLFDED